MVVDDLGSFAASTAGSGGTGSGSSGALVSGSSASSGLVINIVWDSSVANAPAAFTTTVDQVVSYFESHFSNPVTITIDAGYGEVDGQSLGAGALGESATNFNSVSYSVLQNALAANLNAIGDTAAAASLPATSPVNGQWWVSTAQSEALGLTSVSNNPDGYVGFSSAPNMFAYNDSNGVPSNQYDFFGVVAHEISEVMGREIFDGTNPFGMGASYDALDLFHYSAPGVRVFTYTSYASADNGQTSLDAFNTIQGGDLGDWASSAGNDAFNAFSNPGVISSVTQSDLATLNLLGWGTASGGAPVVTIALLNDTSGGKDITANDALTGTADPNATVTISEGSTVLGTTTANASGVWSFTPSGLAQGSQTITASETNAAGLTGYASLTFTYSPTQTSSAHGTQSLLGGAAGTLVGKSADTFLFPPNLGNTTINNFDVKHDVIDLPHSEVADLAAVQAELHAVGNGVIHALDASDSIALTHLQIQACMRRTSIFSKNARSVRASWLDRGLECRFLNFVAVCVLDPRLIANTSQVLDQS